MESNAMLIDVREAARLVSLSPWTIRKYINQGKLRIIRIGRRVLLEPAELRRLIEKGRDGAGREPSIQIPRQ
jgi:excisionase family DNA binding protein